MIIIRDFVDKDIKNCVSLLKNGHDSEFNLARFEWQHLKNPLAPSEMLVAEHDNKIVGFYSAIKKQVMINGRIYIGARDVDPVVHPEYRNKGIFTRMIDHCLSRDSEIDFHFNFANDLSAPGFIRSGWNNIGHISECFIQLGCNKIYSKSSLLYLLSLLKRSRAGEESLQIDMHLEKFRGLQPIVNSEIHVIRSPEYLKWRYLDNPIQTYLYVVKASEFDTSKMLIGRCDKKSNTLYVNDFLFRNSVKDYSLQYMVNFARKAGFQAVRTWQTCSSEISQQMVHNPFGKNHGIKFLVRGRSGRTVPESIFQFENWMLTPGDLEIS